MTRSILPIPLLACCFSLLLAADSTAGKYSSGSRSRSYSSGSRSSSSSSSPSASSSSGRTSGSYSSGSTNSSAGSRSGNFSSSQKAATPSSGSGYTTGRSTYSAGSSASRNAVPATNSSGYDTSAARAKAMQDSSQRFTDSRRVTTPPPIPDTPAAAATAASRTNWRPRERAPMLSAYRSRPAVGFRDGYDLLFWYWLLDQSRPVQAQWIYHHQNQADPARIAELEKKDAALAAEVAALKAQAAPVDPSYTPPGLPAEEMYAQSVAAAEPVTVEEPVIPAQAYPMHSMAGQNEARRGSSGVSWIVLIAGAGFMTWLLFFKRWNVSGS